MHFSETGRESLFEADGGRMMSFLAGAGDGHARSGHADGGGRGAEVQRYEMSIGYNEIGVGRGRSRLVWHCFTGCVAVVDALAAVAPLAVVVAGTDAPNRESHHVVKESR